jgi:hypothetical protein
MRGGEAFGFYNSRGDLGGIRKGTDGVAAK